MEEPADQIGGVGQQTRRQSGNLEQLKPKAHPAWMGAVSARRSS
jgi:hypothetical protein